MIRSCILFILIFGSITLAFSQDELSESPKPVKVVVSSLETVDDSGKFIRPRFPGCEKEEVPGKYKYLCSQKKFAAYMDRVLDYPKDARDEGVQGKVIVTFTVEKDGNISNPTIERSPDERLSAECLKALAFTVEDEYIWKPATVDGELVQSMVRMPIDFRLGYKSIKSKKPITYINVPDIMESAPVGADGTFQFASQSDVDAEKVYDDVEKNPYFEGCNEKGMSLIDRYKCSRKEYYAYIDQQIIYPVGAKADRIQGVAKIECIVEKDGTVTNPRLMRDPGSGLGAEAMRIISAMKDSVGIWSPGKIGDVPVRTRMELPIRFRLSAEDIQPLVVLRHSKKKILHDCTRMEDPLLLNAIDGIKVKKYKSSKVPLEYGEKGRYGVYIAKVSKKLGRKPGAIKRQEEVEAYEMYYKGMTINEADKVLDLQFDEVTAAGEIIIYTIKGRTIAVIQKDLVHTQIVTL